MRDEFDRLARAYAGAQHDAQRLEAAVALAVALAEAGELSGARDAARGAKRYARVLGDQRSRAMALLAAGVVKRYDDDYLGALSCLHEARYHAEGCGDPKVQARVLTAASGAHYELGQYARAIEELTAALGLAFDIDDEPIESEVYRALAGVYSRLEDPVRADGYARRALFIARRRSDDRSVAESLILLGNVAAREQERLFYTGQPDNVAAGEQALAWYAEARPLARRLEDQTLEYRLVNNTARVMLYLDRPQDASRLLAAYLGNGTHELRPHQIAVLRFGVGEATLATDPRAALAILLDAVKLAEAHRAVNHIPKMHLAIANAYERLGDTANALAHHKAYHEVERLVRGEQARAKATLAAIQLEAREIRYESDRLRRASDEMTDWLESLQYQADQLDSRIRRDVLTELANRRAFDEWLDRLFDRESPVVSVALLDIDEFKAINDTHSHLVGDEVLRRVARVLEAAVRLSDMAARYGGEEFGLVLPDTPLAEAAAVCERVRRAVADADWALLRPGLRVTLSAGVSQECGPKLALSVADQRLYAAKRGGRNRVVAG